MTAAPAVLLHSFGCWVEHAGTYEEQIVTLHGLLKSGRSSLNDGKIPADVFRLLMRK
jgi:hypothetical protein|eukprot:COSAG06_NODE_16947_length_971_cov_1.008028_2_plen_57_part_00